ncbi:MAG: heme-binding protein [Thiobacillaceae bacterium]|nr:heme-binding protein [Thiobacillaceae bacterium]MDW8324211.1 heme-binding protein [Burkholderiales bacterium]
MKKMLGLLGAAAVLTASNPSTWAADAPVIVRVPRLTLEAAERLAHAAVMACRAEGVQVAATVVDRSGLPMVVLRDTLAPPVTLEVSRQKAYTAVNFNAPLSSLEDRFTKPFSVGKVEGLVFSAGGLPIEAAGNIVGAVGVSGAPTGAQDEACARKGLEAIQTDLDLAQ